MMKEEPNTKCYFDKKIARVVFKDDEERKIYWFDTSGIHLHHLRHYFHHIPHLHFLHNYFHNIPYYRNNLLPIEEWLKDQGMTCVEDDMCLFELTWV